MIFSVADKPAAAMTHSSVDKLDDATRRGYYGGVEINEIGVVCCRTRTANSMRIVACCTGCVFLHDMFPVF